MKKTTLRTAVALAATLGLLAGCSSDGGDDGADSADGSTLTWWHNSNTAPGKDYYEQVAADFEKANPGVTVTISAMQHEDMLTKLNAAFQTGDTPDVFMERGGGEMAAHVEAGLVKDISEPAAAEIENLGGSVAGWQMDGQTYALPFSLGLVGFWYNKAMFADAGITEAPETMDDLYDAIDKLKATGVEPISVGAGDVWPAAHYWYYLSLRQCSSDVLKDAVTSRDFSDPCFVAAGEDLEELIGTEPFNAGFLATPAQTGPGSASGLLATGKVAMELAGHWEPGVMQGLTEDQQGLGEDTGWFPFPEVEGGAGDPADQLGGGDAWACSEQAPDICVDFIKYLVSDEVQTGFAENSMGLPTNPAATGSVADPVLADLLEVRDEAPFVQLYFDTAFGENVGGAMNDAIALLFAGQATPQEVVDQAQTAADGE